MEQGRHDPCYPDFVSHRFWGGSLMKRSIITTLCLVPLFIFSFVPSARALEPAEVTAVQQLEEQLSDPATVDRLQQAVNTARETATADEKVILDSIEAGLTEIKATPVRGEHSQTRIGRIASKIGIGINRLVAKSLRPFVWGTGYLSGRFGKHREFDEDGDNALSNFLGRLANRFKARGNDAIAELIDRLSKGGNLTSAEVELIVAAMPELDLKEWEGITAGVADGISVGIAVSITAKVFALAGLGGLPGAAFGIFAISWYASFLPCMNEAGIERNPNLARYCEAIIDQYQTIVVPARIKGYLRGVHDWNRSRGR
ncbi:MAG: hypothetical protein EBX52_02495 [Proteobacteria bacterium]|nr:hypothetical protein [Pseudomonadota bacterium]